MSVAPRVAQYLDRAGVAVEHMHHDRVGTLEAALEVSGFSQLQTAVADVLVDPKGAVVVVTRMGWQIDLEKVNKHFKRNLQRVAGRQADRLFRDCEPGSHPPFARAYGAVALCDEVLYDNDFTVTQSGSHTTLLKLGRKAFRQAMMDAKRIPGEFLVSLVPDLTKVTENEVRPVDDRLKRLQKLPPMPTIAARILQTTQDDDATADDLARIIEQDPSLAAQVLRQARSALYGYQGEIATVKDAVLRVLGFERVSQIALSIAASKAFDLPADGPLGLKNFWRHTLHCSVLAQRLAYHIPEKKVEPGVAYMAGLLHNFGLLLFGHLFKVEFEELNKLSEADRYIELKELEVLAMATSEEEVGFSHGELGAELLGYWNLPEELCSAASGHTVRDYEGKNQEYVWIIQLANCLLKELELGDDLLPDDPVFHAQRLSLPSEIIFEVFEQVKNVSGALCDLAEAM